MEDKHSTQNIEDKIMSEIKSGNVKLRSKYIFWVEKWGMGSALALTILGAVLLFCLLLFYLRETDNLWYLSFGSRGVFAFLESFPYTLVVVFIALIFIAGFILKKTGALYAKPFSYVSLVLVLSIMALGTVFTFVHVAEIIERQAFGGKPHGMILRPFFGQGMGKRMWGIAGRVIALDKNSATIQTPQEIIVIDIENLNKKNIPQLEQGLFVAAVGERTKDVFKAFEIKVIPEGKMPMIDRGIERRFGPPRIKMLMNSEARVCVKGCAQNHNTPEICFGECLEKYLPIE
ncbi:MAG: hypothetical protein WCW16_00270 [Candidatus Magasanikbacteria bacterium]